MKAGHNYYVYIVQCSDGMYYTGVTNDLERRLREHNEGLNEKCFTFKRRPVQLKYEEHFNDIRNAIAWEKQVKGWSRKKKESLFIRDWSEISRLGKLKGDKRNAAENPSAGSG
ncbi:MAG: GIY-YIG nuclease family protein [Chitinophagaceae bacterium]|nr:GIY-YIG nuclease family protein [Chitinophagaceae bacterium]